MARPRKHTPAERAEAVRLWDEGNLSAREVAENLGMSYYVVRRALSEAGRDLHGNRRIPRGEKHHSWTGGSYKTAQGYVLETVDPSDPMACMGYGRGGRRPAVMQHRLVMARHLNRPLAPGETVHHINGDRADNRIENLQLRQGLHGPGAAWACGDCGSHNIIPEPLRS